MIIFMVNLYANYLVYISDSVIFFKANKSRVSNSFNCHRNEIKKKKKK